MKMDINQYLSDVAVAVGGTFHARDTYGKAVIGYITLSTGERFWVNAGDYGMEDRVEISPRFPQHQSSERNDARATVQRDFDKDVPHNKKALAPITFAVTKTPAAAARDIERRFLREYRELYARAPLSGATPRPPIGPEKLRLSRLPAITLIRCVTRQIGGFMRIWGTSAATAARSRCTGYAPTTWPSWQNS